ncbi:hypothetical protein L2Y94_20775 [Luteibacter aegosomatis]|uniref:hypothetical protein n=1 Tax=Luteibacter aegosomatis TaxID=2911537 RepID=UPI001FF75C59|nr:hypothetical protein [Luteibacter aegosomatis]UPG85694.1 hypothetical protein L2Y94_20775 [Luteibacter aegosomatis]
MRTVKLSVFIEDPTDVDLEVHLAPSEQAAANAVAPTPAVMPLRPRVVPTVRSDEDEYTLGGYAGI